AGPYEVRRRRFDRHRHRQPEVFSNRTVVGGSAVVGIAGLARGKTWYPTRVSVSRAGSACMGFRVYRLLPGEGRFGWMRRFAPIVVLGRKLRCLLSPLSGRKGGVENSHLLRP